MDPLPRRRRPFRALALLLFLLAPPFLRAADPPATRPSPAATAAKVGATLLSGSTPGAYLDLTVN
jgi:hypothetical protein